MAEPTITDVFGAGASCTSAALTIPATFFQSQGLTISGTTHAESLLVAMMLNISPILSETARSQDLVNRNVTVTYAGQDTITQATSQYQRDVWSVVAYKETPLNPVDPNQY